MSSILILLTGVQARCNSRYTAPLWIPHAHRKSQERSQSSRPGRRWRSKPQPSKVTDPRFLGGDFFDPRDIVQVKYEMLRRVSVEATSVTDATGEYGVSRPTYYKAKEEFDKAGVAGLVRRREVLEVHTSFRARCWPSSSSSTFRARHPRTRTCSDGPGEILCRGPSKNYRACANYKKKSSATPCNVGYGPTSRDIVEQYETLRAAALGGGLPFDARSGLALFLRRGMWGWAQAATTPETLVHSRRPIASRMNSDEHQIVSQLFASMVMSISQRRTNEHISQSSIAPSRA